MDWPLQDNAHGKASKRACSFSPEENGCGISFYPFSSGAYSSFPSLRLRANMRMRSIKMLDAGAIMKLIYGLILLNFSTSVFAEAYSVNVKREDSNLYRESSGLYIETRYCYEYTYGDDAILKYEQGSYSNKLIFSSGTECQVKSVFKPSSSSGSTTTSSNGSRSSYEIEVAHNDELFIINGEKYEAQTYCLGWETGESVIFLEGSEYGACASAKLFNVNRDEICDVWCE